MKVAQGVQTVQTGTRQDLLRRTAQSISQIGSPPLTTLTGAAFLFAATSGQTSIDWLSLSAFAFFSVLLPLAYVAWLLQRGQIEDMHMKHRHERIKPLWLTCVTNVAGVALLWEYDPNSTMFIFALVQCVLAFMFLVITPWFKISLHSASASVFLLLSMQIMDFMMFPLVALVLVGWSRLFLQRHTPMQVVAGTALGGLVWLCIW